MSDWDGLYVCETCGNQYTTGRLCTSCAWQEMIDNDTGPYGGAPYQPEEMTEETHPHMFAGDNPGEDANGDSYGNLDLP